MAKSSQGIHPSFGILEIIEGAWLASAVQLAMRLGIADLLEEGPQSVQALAEKTGTHKESLYRLLRALAGKGIFEESTNPPEVFAQSALSSALCSDRPDSIYLMTRMFGEPWQRQIWDGLEQSIRTGTSGFGHVHGMEIWQYLSENPEAKRTFNLGMTSFSGMVNEPIARAYDFAPYQKIVDLGGGHGSLLSTVLRTYPTVQGVLFDLPMVIEEAQKRVDPALQGRYELVSGSFFQEIPTGAHLYMMKQVLHDWEDKECVAILQKCREAMQVNGRVLVADRVILSPEEDHFSSFNKLWDLLMLTVVGGRERTRAEFARIFEAAGFSLTRVITTGTPISLVEGIAKA